MPACAKTICARTRKPSAPKERSTLTNGVQKQLQSEANCAVVSNFTYRVSASLKEPRILNTNAFLRHYREQPYVAFPNRPGPLAEPGGHSLGAMAGPKPAIDMETQPVRFYPNHSLAANLLGYVQRRNASDGRKFSLRHA